VGLTWKKTLVFLVDIDIRVTIWPYLSAETPMFDITKWIRLPQDRKIYGKDLEDAGYPYVYTSKDHFGKWQEMHHWCNTVIGADRYTWTGDVFWFLTEDDAVKFSLVWG
jgi:hypothetical protein